MAKRQASAAKASATNSGGLEKVTISIELNKDNKITKEVFDFEVPVIVALHGEVTELGRADVADKDTPGVDQAWRMLVGRYNTKSGEEALASVYSGEDDFARKTGLAEKDDE